MRKKISKVMLIYPPRTILKDSVKRCPTPLGLAYIAAVLEKENYEVRILDAAVEGYYNEIPKGDYITFGLSLSEIKEKIIDYSPDVIGVTCPFSSEINMVYSICKLINELNENIIVVVGGLHPSLYPEDAIKEKGIDYVVMGEGEYRFLELLDRLNNDESIYGMDGIAYRDGNKNVIFPNKKFIENLDELPFPARHLLQMEKYLKINKHISPYSRKRRVEQILTSRGCPGRCIFCASSNYWGHRYRARSPENIIEEMKILVKTYGIEEIQFTDDNLTWDRTRALKLFELMKKELNIVWSAANGVMVKTLTPEMIRLMKESGCYQLTFSIEHGNQEVLTKIMKKPVNLKKVGPLVEEAKRVGISLHATFVMGFPEETLDQVQDCFRFARKTDFDSVSYFIVSPIPGSKLYENCKRKNLLKSDFKTGALDFKTPSIKLLNFSEEDLVRLIDSENSRFIKNFIIKHPLRAIKKYGTFILSNPRELFKIFGRVT
jgi:radical SAM superfamily enzyme YgiQ (UPF0313 family)